MPAIATRAAPAGKTEATGQTTVQVQTDKTYYELPRWSVGAKLTAYCSDYAGGDYPSVPSRAKERTADGKNWIECLQEMKLGFVGASMNRQGRPPNKGKPAPNFDDWRAAASAVAKSGGGIMIEYMGGVNGMPNGTKMKPEEANNVDPDPGDWSVQNCVDWADYMASMHGPDKIFLFEFYNEPACMNNQQMGAGGGYWYSYKDFKNADRLCADWAINHQQDYYKAVKAKYPDAVVTGTSYSSPAGKYGVGEKGECMRYLRGYPGARVSATNPNSKYQDAFGLHSYGFEVGSNAYNTPGAPSGDVQAIFNSIFYPTAKDLGVVAGYKAGVDQWVKYARSLPGGKTNGVVNTEWWAHSPKETAGGAEAGGKDGSLQAVADVLGWIVHCQNADRWQFKAIEFHAVSTCPADVPNAQKRPTRFKVSDCIFCSFDGKLFRTGRYYAIKDICAPFANNYTNLVRSVVKGPASPPSARKNSVATQIQVCSGLNKDKSSLAVCLANIGSSTQAVTVSLGRRASGAAKGVKIPASLDVDTPLTELSPKFTDDSNQSVSVTLEGYTAALIEVPL